MDRNSDDFGTLNEVKIRDIWGLCAGSFVYEGCGVLLSDGRPCALGKHKRRLRRQNSESPLGPHSRGRVDHDCCVDGAGVYMFCFAIQVGDFVMQVNESSGEQLMGRSGQAFKDACEIDEEEQTRLCELAMRSSWKIAYVKDRSRECQYRALSFDKCPSEAVDGGFSKVVDACSSEAESKGDGRAAWLGKLKGKVLDFSGGIAESLRSFSISE